jgi:hypothetical protein
MLRRRTIYCWRKTSWWLLSWSSLCCWSWRVLGMLHLCYFIAYILKCILSKR